MGQSVWGRGAELFDSAAEAGAASGAMSSLRPWLFGVAVVLATVGVGTPTAQATPFLTSFDNAYLKTAALAGAGADVLDVPPTNAAEIGGDLNLATGAFSGGGFNSELIVPEIEGIATTIDFDETEQITGTVDIATGSVATNPSAYRAILTVDPTPGNPGDEDTCVVGDEPGGADTADLVLAFSTEADYPSPYKGDRFTVDSPALATHALNDGAVVATWSSVPPAIHTAAPGNCSFADALTQGSGALWVADDLTSPTLSTPPIPTPTNPTPPGTHPPPSSTDTDGDGVLDSTDNCLKVFNPDQLDGNHNGRGAACDLSEPFYPLTLPHTASQNASNLLSKGIGLNIRCVRACSVSTKLTFGKQTAKQLGVPRAAGKATDSLPGAGTKLVLVKPNTGAKKALSLTGAEKKLAKPAGTTSIKLTITAKIVDSANYKGTFVAAGSATVKRVLVPASTGKSAKPQTKVIIPAHQPFHETLTCGVHGRRWAKLNCPGGGGGMVKG